jgi:uncharacterized membrane protein (UPF0182 family)
VINREPVTFRPRSRLRRVLIVLGLALVVFLLAMRWLATLWTDYLWYDSLDRTSVWSTLVFTRVWMVLAAALFAFIVFWVNLYIVDWLSPRTGVAPGSPDEELLERFQDWIAPRAGRVRLLVAAFFGFMIGLGAAAWWQDWLLFRHGGEFGIADPIFNNDVGLYVFDLPFYRDVFSWTFQLLLVLTLVVVAAHYLNGGINVQGPGERTSGGVKAHISILLALLALLKAVGYQLDKWELLYSTRGKVVGASFTDVNAQIPALNLLIIISVVAAIILLVNLRFRGWILPLVAVGLWLVTSIAVAGIYPTLVQRFRVEPNEVTLEAPYVENNIGFTREAFQLDQVEVQPFAASTTLVADDIAANEPTLNNVRLWDPGVLGVTYREVQNIRTFYNIFDVDVDRYNVDGELTQVMVSGRELDEADLPPPGGWVNEHLVYTHGYGQVVSTANDVTTEGQPDFLLSDIEDVYTVEGTPDLTVEEPRLYFSDSATSRFLIVGTKEREVDRPDLSGGAQVSYNTYSGEGGVELGNIFHRAAWALRFGDLNTLISRQLTSDSRILLERDVRQRVLRLVPFLATDADPYLIIADGRLQWVVDLYTVTDQYPYSQLADTSRLNATQGLPNSFNYIRNSVKAVVDAYDGTTALYIIDEEDPMIQAFRRIFPDVFQDRSQIPQSVIQHLRYPEDLFRVQTDMYRLYHVTNPQNFFSNVDPWQIARDPSTSPRPALRDPRLDADSSRPMLPYYLLMKLPGEERLSFLLMQPFTPQARPNMVAFMVAKSGPTLEEYGRVIEYQLPANSQIDGPGQVGDFINQDPEISAQFTLLGQGGSTVIQGNMLVTPIEESLLYIQPIYISATEGGVSGNAGIPELKRVVVSFNNQIEIADTLDEALFNLFGAGISGEIPPPSDGGEGPVVDVPERITELLVEADAAFAAAEAALRDGDLATYEQKIEEAEAAVEEATSLIEGVVDEGAEA